MTAKRPQSRMKAAALKRGRRVVSDDGPDPIDKHVGMRLRERRLQAGLTQRAVADPIGVSFQVVQRYEAGDVRISASTLYRLARMLGVEPNDFFDGYEGPVALRAQKVRRPR
jgi:ribosome-binding protein aMBF1 (putative translation factor)